MQKEITLHVKHKHIIYHDKLTKTSIELKNKQRFISLDNERYGTFCLGWITVLIDDTKFVIINPSIEHNLTFNVRKYVVSDLFITIEQMQNEISRLKNILESSNDRNEIFHLTDEVSKLQLLIK